MKRWLVVVGAVAWETPADAGKLFDPSLGMSTPVVSADCGRGQWPAQDPIPMWSRLHWSVQTGIAATTDDVVSVLVPAVGFALWAKEWRCASGTGLFADHLWRRWSLSITSDVALRTDDHGTDVRPALRLARSHARRGLLSVGSEWVPSTELFVTVGPTFEPAWSGAALGIGGRISIISVELRVAIRTEDRGGEVMLLAGVTDLHGLWRLGARRSL